jgi:hypothetical protein
MAKSDHGKGLILGLGVVGSNPAAPTSNSFVSALHKGDRLQ